MSVRAKEFLATFATTNHQPQPFSHSAVLVDLVSWSMTTDYGEFMMSS